eukprot:TRINITY_DN24912_c0_g1_i1.p1 TRINITY_DN24912_c0_g1~~TRINITY_DN24912_c0_g1_i1.p1  ORF type:complete len:505 (-),score=114.61 TRINITY_DN24912_c0_g1_i1:245-1720(-)
MALEEEDAWGLFGDDEAAPTGGLGDGATDAKEGSAAAGDVSRGASEGLRLEVLQARARVLTLANKVVPLTVADLQAADSEAQWTARSLQLDQALAKLRSGTAGDLALHESVSALAQEAFREVEQAGRWKQPAHRELFCVAAAMGAVAAASLFQSEPGDARSAALLAALKHLDVASVFGLPSDVSGPVAAALESALTVANVLPSPASFEGGLQEKAEPWLTVGPEPEMTGPRVLSVTAGELTLEQFRRDYYGRSGVAVRQLAHDWPAHTVFAGRAGLRRLGCRHGHRTIPVELRDASGALTEKLMSLKDFIETKLLASDAKSKAEAGLTAYLAQHDLFGQIPALRELIQVPAFCSAGRLGPVNAWLGTGGTITRAHFDSYDNLFVQLTGRKYIRLLENDQAPFLYCAKRGTKRQLCTTEAATEEKASLDELAQGNMTEVPNLESYDKEQYPLLAQAAYQEIVLDAGDALYIPAGMWHYVRSLSTSFSVNFWF